MMRKMLRTLLSILVASLFSLAAAGARVDVTDGRIGAAFEDAAVPEALSAIRLATGFEIVVPAVAQSKRLTLTSEPLPPEQFLRRLLQALDLGGFALVYEGDGSARRVIVVDRSSAPPQEAPARSAEPTEAPAAAETGPVYIPPASPPVYIPPARPPVYIPPASPPVYIPAASPPVYVPPATESQPTRPTPRT
jgi:type II secretory pathway component GspD/PulD (secretin)